MVEVGGSGWWLKKNIYIYINYIYTYQGSLSYPFWGDQTMPMHGEFERFPENIVHCSGW